MSGTPWATSALLRGGDAVRFGLGYDDERIELEALPRGRALVIAGSGEVAAALASVGDEVTAIDIRPAQRAYAEQRVAGGPTQLGEAERLLAIGRAALAIAQPVWRPGRLARLLELPADRAVEAWRRHFATRTTRALLRAVLGARGAVGALMPAELRAGIPAGFSDDVLERIEQRLGDPHNRFLARLLLGGAHDPWRPPGHGPITWLDGDVLEHLERVDPGTYDAISLSNIGDAATDAWVDRLRSATTRALAPGGVALLRAVSRDGEDEARDLAGRDRSALWGAIHRWRPAGRCDEGTRMIRAAPSAVWDVLVDADRVGAWLPPEGMTAVVREYGAHVGAAIAVSLHWDEPGEGKTDAGRDDVLGSVIEARPGRVLTWSMTFDSDDPAFAGSMRMRWSLTPLGDGTLVRLTATGVPEGIGVAEHLQGLRSTLASLGAAVEADVQRGRA